MPSSKPLGLGCQIRGLGRIQRAAGQKCASVPEFAQLAAAASPRPTVRPDDDPGTPALARPGGRGGPMPAVPPTIRHQTR